MLRFWLLNKINIVEHIIRKKQRSFNRARQTMTNALNMNGHNSVGVSSEVMSRREFDVKRRKTATAQSHVVRKCAHSCLGLVGANQFREESISIVLITISWKCDNFFGSAHSFSSHFSFSFHPRVTHSRLKRNLRVQNS